MPTRTSQAAVWNEDYFERGVKYAMEIDKQDQPLKEMRAATIILEGDLRVKIRAWDSHYCLIRYGKDKTKEVKLLRKFMNFRYAKAKAHAVS